MIRALLVDDEAPARERLRKLLSAHPDVQVAGEAMDGEEALERIAALAPDIVFLDIQMPGCTGLEVAASLPAPRPRIVFCTAFDEHAIKAFELNAIDYLLKPYDKDRLLKTLSRIRSRPADGSARAAVTTARAQTQSHDRLLVPVGETLQLIDSATVEWLEASDNYVHVHTTSRSYLLRRTLHDLLEQLGDQQFARIHKSAAVNIAAVKAFTPLFKGDYEVQLRNGKVLRLSRRFKDQLFGRMGR